MNIKAKMKCESVLKTEFGEEVKLTAVSSGSEENKTFSKYTPSANHSMTITNPDALGAFAPGKSYYLTFEEAPQ